MKKGRKKKNRFFLKKTKRRFFFKKRGKKGGKKESKEGEGSIFAEIAKSHRNPIFPDNLIIGQNGPTSPQVRRSNCSKGEEMRVGKEALKEKANKQTKKGNQHPQSAAAAMHCKAISKGLDIVSDITVRCIKQDNAVCC